MKESYILLVSLLPGSFWIIPAFGITLYERFVTLLLAVTFALLRGHLLLSLLILRIICNAGKSFLKIRGALSRKLILALKQLTKYILMFFGEINT